MSTPDLHNAAVERRLTVLFVGYPRRPFTIEKWSDSISLAQRLGIDQYQERTRGRISCFECPAFRCRDHSCCHLRVYAAIPSGSQDFLRIHDQDTAALMWLKTNPEGQALRTKYLTEKNEITLKRSTMWARLAARIGQLAAKSDNWNRDGDEIHLLAVLVQGKVSPIYNPRFKIKLDFGDLRPSLDRCAWLGRQVAYSTQFDLWCHVDPWTGDAPCFDLLRVLNPAASSSDCSFTSLPDFKHIVVTRLLCPSHRDDRLPELEQPSTKPAGPATLQQLAENAAIEALLHNEPPPFVDAIDCVVDADLYNTDTRVVESVRGYVVFDDAVRERLYRPNSDHYVNQTMLAALDSCSTLGDPLRPRLLIIVKNSQHEECRVSASCIPTGFPTVTASLSNVYCGDGVLFGNLKYPFAAASWSARSCTGRTNK